MTASSPLVCVQNLSKHYHTEKFSVKAVDDISLSIKKGEFLSIMGASGSGKSTLMHLLGCLDRATSGKYLLENEDVSLFSEYKLAQIRCHKIGFIFQFFNLVPQLTVLENVLLPFQYREVKDRKIQNEKACWALERVGLSHRLFHRPKELSGGEAQRAAIARAIVAEPILILADEPTGNLDSNNGKKILSLFSQFHVEGMTIVVVTHDDHVAKHAQRIVHMSDGKIIQDENQCVEIY